MIFQSNFQDLNNIDGRDIDMATRRVYKQAQKYLEKEGDIFEHLI